MNNLFPLRYNNVTLRPMCESDIPDDEKWFSVETEWGEWDAPWEENSTVEERLEWRRNVLKKNADTPPKFYGFLDMDTDEGRHIGWVTCYTIDIDDVIAVGINIPPPDARRKGYGKNALLCYMDYIFSRKDVEELYTQTWSGNFPMIKLAEVIGFTEIGRIKGIRKVRGGRYDALTFSMSRNDFYERHTDFSL